MQRKRAKQPALANYISNTLEQQVVHTNLEITYKSINDKSVVLRCLVQCVWRRKSTYMQHHELTMNVGYDTQDIRRLMLQTMDSMLTCL